MSSDLPPPPPPPAPPASAGTPSAPPAPPAVANHQPPCPPYVKEIVLVTGISGSGKSVALHALEDADYYCVDNLPPELLRAFLQLERSRGDRKIAIAVDVRSVGSLPHLLPTLNELRRAGVRVHSIFLDASTDALLRRFSESRRPHPLTTVQAEHSLDREHVVPISGQRALTDAIDLERQLLAELREHSTVIDTSHFKPAKLRETIRDLVTAASQRLTLVFESFAFKHGVPLDADYVFDVRVLPNPHYVPELRPLTGRDLGVAQFLAAEPDVVSMLGQIEAFIAHWLPAFEKDQRSYLTVAIGCTGGQHRSVYFAERLGERFQSRTPTLIRHREIGVTV